MFLQKKNKIFLLKCISYIYMYYFYTIKQNEKIKIMKAMIKLTVSHNEVTANYSVMCKPSTLKVKIDEDKYKLAQQFPYLLDVWGQQIWDMNYPNTFGKVIKTEFCN